MQFLGRKDDQVKIRGQRVELAEIDSILLDHKAVRDCATIVVDSDDRDGKQLVSFWIPKDYNKMIENEDFEILDIFDYIQSFLPAYMIPSLLVPVSTIPMTPTAKINKRGLEAQFRGLDRVTAQRYSNRIKINDQNNDIFTEMEAKIAQCVAQSTAVPLPDIDKYSSFFQLGLDSVSAVSLSKNLKSKGLGQIDVSVIMRHSSVRELSNKLEETSTPTQKVFESNIQNTFDAGFISATGKRAKENGQAVKKVVPCTPLQEAMLSKHESDKNGSYYNHLTFEIFGETEALKNALTALVSRHDILRTYFIPTEDVRFPFAQVVLQGIDLPWQVFCVSTEHIEDTIITQKSLPIRVEGPLMPYKFTVFHNSDNGRKLLLLSVSHALYDGEAMSLLLREIEMLWLKKTLPQTVSFDPYLDAMVNLDMGQSDTFWEKYLAGLTKISIFNSQSPPERLSTFRSNHTELRYSLDHFMRACRNIPATSLGVLQAAWASLLFRYSGTSDVCFGNVFNCRSIPVDGIEQIIAPCFNTLPVRVEVNSTSTNSELIQTLQKHNADILPFQLSSLRHLQSKFSRNGSRLFDTLFLLQTSPRPLNEELWRLLQDEGSMDFPIICEVTPNDITDTVQLSLHYDESLISSKDVCTISKEYVDTIHRILQFPSARVADGRTLSQNLPCFVDKLTLSENPVDKTEKDHLSLNRTESQYDIASEISHVRDILSSLSKVDPYDIAPTTTIFQLGLDSINAIQVSRRLKGFGYGISAADIIEVKSVHSNFEVTLLMRTGTFFGKDCIPSQTYCSTAALFRTFGF